MSVVLPPMTRGQAEAWSGLLDLSERHPTCWTLVGGQMVHLHCIERGVAPTRPTDDVDAVLDVRAEPDALRSFTTALVELGFVAIGESWEGHQHRWQRGEAQIDVLIPRHLGERAAGRRDREYLGTMLAALAADRRAWAGVEGADDGIARLHLALAPAPGARFADADPFPRRRRD